MNNPHDFVYARHPSAGVELMGNASDYKLLDAGTVRALAATHAAGFQSQMVSASTVLASP